MTYEASKRTAFKKNHFLVAFLKVTDENRSIQSHPLIRGTDPRIRIRIKMLRIRNIGYKRELVVCREVTGRIR
jgi:hypothetical protein